MRDTTDKKLSDTQRRYKDYYDRRIRTVTSFVLGQLVYVDRPPFAVAVADRVATDSYLKVLPRKSGPYCIVSGAAETVTKEEDKIPSTIWSDRPFIAVQ